MSDKIEEKNTTIFGKETEFVGNLRFRDNLEITGKFEGTIESEGNLIIAKNAECTADTITAGSIIISGTVTGNMEAQDKVELRQGSVITGNIKTARLKIDDGVIFDGKVTMLETLPDVNIFDCKVSELNEAFSR